MNGQIPQWKGWGIVLSLGLIEFVSYLFLFLIEKDVFSSLPVDLLALFVKVLVYVLVILYCMARFGKIDLVELITDRRDAIVLVVALLIEFWIFGLLVGPDGITTDWHEEIRGFTASQYWLAVFMLVGLVPLTEEAVFRRYFLEIQRQHFSTGIAVLITAGVAALFHFKGSFLPLAWHFSQQVFLSIVYVKSRLGVSVLVHAFVNALVLFLSR